LILFGLHQWWMLSLLWGRKNLFFRRRRRRNRFCATISLVRNLSNHFRRPMPHLNSSMGMTPSFRACGTYVSGDFETGFVLQSHWSETCQTTFDAPSFIQPCSWARPQKYIFKLKIINSPFPLPFVHNTEGCRNSLFCKIFFELSREISSGQIIFLIF